MRRSLAGPPAIQEADTPDETYQAIVDHLGLELDDKRRATIDRIPSVETLPQTSLNVGDTEAELNEAEIERRLDVARRWLGFKEWRPGQLGVMRRIMRGEDAVAVLPTGSGKSVTYQIPALVSPGVTVVVSPLIALMRDQVDNLRARGVQEVAAIYSGVSQTEQEAILHSAARGHLKLLYISPERLWSPRFRTLMREVDVARIAVDEAHCISLWGHSFRPEYAQIPKAIATLTESANRNATRVAEVDAKSDTTGSADRDATGNGSRDTECSSPTATVTATGRSRRGGRQPQHGDRLPVAAVTATATPGVLENIAELLCLEPAVDPIIGSVDRPEIRYYVERCANLKDRDLRVVQIVEAFRYKSAIVYVPTPKDTVRLAAMLCTFHHRVRPYNGTMEPTERQHTEDAFRHNEIDVVVATKAFGLGIDKPDIALIVHLEMPASIEEYMQETGRLARGARDGEGPETGTAVLLEKQQDCTIHDHFIRSSTPDLETIRQVWSSLDTGMNFINPVQFTDQLAADRAAESQAAGSHTTPHTPDWTIDPHAADRARDSHAADSHTTDPAADHDSRDEDRQQAVALALHYLHHVKAVRRHQDFVLRGRITSVEATEQRMETLREHDPKLAVPAIRIMELVKQEDGNYDGLRWRTLLGMAPSEVEATLYELQRLDICGFSSWKYGWRFERTSGSEPDWNRLRDLIKERRSEVKCRSEQAQAFARGRSLENPPPKPRPTSAAAKRRSRSRGRSLEDPTAAQPGRDALGASPPGSPSSSFHKPAAAKASQAAAPAPGERHSRVSASARCRRREMLRYMGEPDPLGVDPWVCGACDACTPDLPRPWQGSEISREGAADAVREDAPTIALVLIDGVEGGLWSKHNLVRTLLGQGGGKYPLHRTLKSNSCYSRLAFLDRQETEELLDDLIADGYAEELTPEGRDYKTLRLTPEGRQRII